jgi:biopolymer transport protein ExbD
LFLHTGLTAGIGGRSGRAIPAGQLAAALDAATSADRDKRIFLRADKSVPYGELTRVMNLLRAAGYLKVALVGLEGVDGPPVAGSAN